MVQIYILIYVVCVHGVKVVEYPFGAHSRSSLASYVTFCSWRLHMCYPPRSLDTSLLCSAHCLLWLRLFGVWSYGVGWPGPSANQTQHSTTKLSKKLWSCQRYLSSTSSLLKVSPLLVFWCSDHKCPQAAYHRGGPNLPRHFNHFKSNHGTELLVHTPAGIILRANIWRSEISEHLETVGGYMSQKTRIAS
jgi:hypothetical protein